MKKHFLILCCLLAGCNETASVKVHVQDGPSLPKPKVTRTITETTLVETPVPLYRIDKQITTNTKTLTDSGAAAAPLHDTKLTGAGAGTIPDTRRDGAPAPGTASLADPAVEC